MVYALSDPAPWESFLQDHAEQIVQAPIWQAPRKSHPLSQTYAENLSRNGYWHKDSLQDQLKGWLALLEDCRPDLILAEHAPSALLAARHANLPRAAIGTGFTIPPLEEPMPGFQPWFALPKQYLQESEQAFLDCVNTVLRELGAAPLHAVADIFEGAVRFLCTFPELDHYGVRADAAYCGPVIYTPQDRKESWTSNARDNVFIYLHANNPFFRPIIARIKEMQQPTVAFVPGLSDDERHSLQAGTLTIVNDPVNLKAAASHCQLMICHGGHNAGTLMLLAGVPLLICPSQLEQAIWAYRICEQGLGVMFNYFDSHPDIGKKLESAFTFPVKPVADFAKKYDQFDSRVVVGDVASKCLELVGIHAYGT